MQPPLPALLSMASTVRYVKHFGRCGLVSSSPSDAELASAGQPSYDAGRLDQTEKGTFICASW